MSKLVQLKRVTDGAWGRSHHPLEAMGVWGPSTQPVGGFLKVFGKKMAILMPFGSHFARFQSHLKANQTNPSLYLLVKSKTRLKSCIWGLNFVTWPGRGNQGTLLSTTFLAQNYSLEDLPLKIFV